VTPACQRGAIRALAPVVEADLRDAARLLRGREHRARRSDIVRERLLADHVLAVRQRVDRDLGVQDVGDADVDDVDVLGARDRSPVKLGALPAPGGGELLGPLGVRVGDRGERHLAGRASGKIPGTAR
jgi:hypothetical protein